MLKSQKLTLSTALIAASCVAVGQKAQATIDYTIANAGGAATQSGYQDLQVVNVSIDGSGSFSAFCGGIVIDEAGGPAPGLPTQYTTVCTDLNGLLYLGNTYTYNAPTSFSGQTGIAPYWGAGNGTSVVNPGTAAMAIQNAAFIFNNFGGLTSAGMTGSADQMAAVQLAVWLSLYDTTGNGQVLVNGLSRMQVQGFGDATIQGLVLQYLTILDSSLNAGAFGYTGAIFTPTLPYPSNNGGEPPQELLYMTPVPEPSTIIAGIATLLPFGAASLRSIRNRRNS